MRHEAARNGSIPLELAGDGRFVIPHREFVPVYLETYRNGALHTKLNEAMELLRSCQVCPRNCKVDRLENQAGLCRTGRLARVASAFAHFGEEDCLRGWNGSGTILFGRVQPALRFLPEL